MDEAMAPPLKRRKLSTSPSEQYFRLDNSTAPADAVQSYSNGVDSSQHTYSSLAPSRTGLPQDDNRARIQQPVVGGIADFKVLVPRQGTGSSSSTMVSTDSENALTVLEDSITSMTASISISLSVSASSPTLPADTVPAGVTPSESSSSTTPQSSSPSSYSSSTGSSSSINETSSITSSASLSTSTSTSESSSRSQNLTTSALILQGESTTTSKTTINLDNQTSSTSATDSAFLWFVTLENGDVRTFSRQSGAYTTTLGDGETFTIPSISATTTSDRTTTSSRTSTPSRTSTSTSSPEQSTVTSTMQVTGAVAGQGESTPTYSSTTSSTSAASGGGGGGSNDTPPAGTIAGGVVGGAAGLAVLVLIAMLFVRWYRRKSQVGHRELPPGSSASPEAEQPADRSGPGMAERAGLMPFAAALPALFRHQNRSAEGSAPSERGFTRVSGRKLPSAFSEGMSSEGARSHPPPGMPLTGSPPDERNLSSTSFYRDSAGFYGGDGTGEPGRSSASPTSLHSPTSPSSSAPIHSGPEMMTMSPGPQRHPQVHAGGPYTLSPVTSEHPGSPPAAAAQFARSDTPSSLRNSRFTEDM